MCRALAISFVSVMCWVLADPHAQLQAAITTTGNISPTNPATWTLSTTGYVGSKSDGALTIDDGSSVSVEHLYIGSGSSATGIVTVDGTVSPSSLTTNSIRVGSSGNGTLRIIGGGSVVTGGYVSTDMTIGYSATSTGQILVDGAGSSLNNHSNLYVGHLGSGTLSISGGAVVNVTDATYAADGAGSTGAIGFGGCGGTLTTGALAASPSQLYGTGTIIAHGLVSDVNLVFDSPASLSQTVRFNSLGQNITLNLDMTNPKENVALGVGWQGAGSLAIRNGTAVSSGWGCIGYGPNSVGTVTVDGIGSQWKNGGSIISTGLLSGGLSVGYQGRGTLTVTHGGVVNGGYSGRIAPSGTVTVDGSGSEWTGTAITVDGAMVVRNGGKVDVDLSSYIGRYSGCSGTVTVSGAGSSWKTLYMDVGNSGTGVLNVVGGAVVSSLYDLIINSHSMLAVDVGRGQRGQRESRWWHIQKQRHGSPLGWRRCCSGILQSDLRAPPGLAVGSTRRSVVHGTRARMSSPFRTSKKVYLERPWRWGCED